MKDNQKLIFLSLLKQIVFLADSGDILRLDRPNSQIDEDFNAAIDRLRGIGVEVTTQPSSFADNYTYYSFTWQDMANCIARNKPVFSVSGNKTSNNLIKDGTKSTDHNNLVAGSRWIKKTWPRDKGLFLVVKEIKGDDVAYSDASTNLRYAHISKKELLRDYDYLTQEDIDNM